MPGRLSVKIIAARNLPVMDRASEACDAFTEIRLGTTCYKTEIFKKSLNPIWNSEWFSFEVDDEALQDERLQLRVMDYDTYSANDAIGKVYIDLNHLLSGERTTMQGWLPIFDTLHGLRGEIDVFITVDLISDANIYRASSIGMSFFYSSKVPNGYRLLSILGFTEELIAGDDPEFHWMDRIRTPRASNEQRQTLFARLSGQLQRRVGLKALELGGSAVIGYQQSFDIEGDTGIVARGIGTVVKLSRCEESDQPAATTTILRPLISENMSEYPFITLKSVPSGVIERIGGTVSARSVKLLDNSLESELETRDLWWTELRREIRAHSKSLGCNIVVGYSETTSICEDLLLLSACGTAALLSTAHGDNLKSTCSLFHAPSRNNSNPTKSRSMQLDSCSSCRSGKVPDFMFMTIELDDSVSESTLIQARVCKTRKELKGEAGARDISENLPFLEYELHKQLLSSLKNSRLNAVVGLSMQVAIGERFVTGIASGTACLVACLPKPERESISKSGSESEDDEMSAPFKRMCILSVDSAGIGGSIPHIIPHFPDGFKFHTGLESGASNEIFSSCQFLLQSFRFRLNRTAKEVPQVTLPVQNNHRQLEQQFDHSVQSMFARLRNLRPCRVAGIKMEILFSQADEMQLTISGNAFHNVSSPTPLYCVEISSMSNIPGRFVVKHLGNFNIFLIRETTNLTQRLNSFVAAFLNEVLAIARCHVAALGGNAIISFRLNHQLLLHGTHKNQGQCLVNAQGDAVWLKSDIR